MAKAQNRVIAGDYCGWDVVIGGSKMALMYRLTKLNVDKTDIVKWELVDSQSGNSFWSSFLRGYIGNAVLGPAGVLASTMHSASAKNYFISIEFVTGKRSLLEVDDKLCRKIIQIFY